MAPPVASLADRFSPTRDSYVVLLTLPAWRSESANVAPGNGVDGGLLSHPDGLRLDANGIEQARFVETVATVRDETSGEDAVEIHFASKQLRLCLDDEIPPGAATLPIARIRRDGSGRFVVDPDYIPPALQIGASERLLEVLRTMIEMLEAKGASLSSSLGSGLGLPGATPAAYIGNELATRWCCTRSARRRRRCVITSPLVARIRSGCGRAVEARRCAVYVLAHDAGARSSGVHARRPRRVLRALERHLRTHLDVVVAAKAVVIALTRGDDTLYGAAVTDPRCFDRAARWFLGVRCNLSQRDTIVGVPQLAKVCARKFVLELARRAVPGFVLEHVPAPPAGVAPRAELAYFEIRRDGPCDKALDAARELGVYLPDTFGEAHVELAVLVAG
jgi:type VI secretion system protein ImpJ